MNGDIRSTSSPGSSDLSEQSAGTNAFLPIVLLALSLIFIFIWQLTNLSKQRDTVRATQQQLEAAFRNSTPQQEQVIQQSRAVQAKLEALVTDVLALARDGDPDARALVDKYKIQQSAPPATAAPSPATAP